MSKNYKWGIFPGKWGAKAKKAAPRRIKNGAACCETPRRTSAETHPASAAPARRPPRVHSYPRGTARRKRYGPFPSTLRGAFVLCRSSGTTERHSPNGQPTSRQRSGNTAACGQRAYTPRAAKRRRFQNRKQCPNIKRITDRRIAD